MLRTCENCMRELGWPKCMGMLGWLELACPTTWACLFKVRPGVLSKTLSHIWGMFNLPIFVFKVFLFKELLKDPSPIHHHGSNTGHPTTQQNFQIKGREGMA